MRKNCTREPPHRTGWDDIHIQPPVWRPLGHIFSRGSGRARGYQPRMEGVRSWSSLDSVGADHP